MARPAVPRVVPLPALAALAFVLAGCGGSSGPASSGTSSTQPSSGAGATSAVKQAYAVLFDLASPALQPKVAVVQDGASLQASLAKELRSPLAKLAAGASVTDVAVQPTSACSGETLPSPCASLEYAILSPTGKPLLSASKGWAVYVDGKWLVAKLTICGLLAIASGGTAPAGC